MQATKSLAELAVLVDGEVIGDPGVVICGVNDLSSARPGEITFVTKAKFAEQLSSSSASAVIIPSDMADVSLSAIRVKNPQLAAAIIHNVFYQRPRPASGIHPLAHVGQDCSIAPSVSIAPLAVIGNRVTLAEGVVVEPGVVVGDDVAIGEETVLEANVVVRSGCIIGKRVIIYSGAIIGSDGFGYATDAGGNHVKRPQVGNVVIEDDAEIGANSCVDRATFGTTRIGRGAKIDNLVQIAHNVEIGPSCIVVSQSGIAGSTRVGRNVVMGGQTGIGDHVEIGDGVMIAARSGVNSNVAAGKVVAGFPAINYREWLQAATAFSRIPQVIKDIRALRKKVDELPEEENSKEKKDE